MSSLGTFLSNGNVTDNGGTTMEDVVNQDTTDTTSTTDTTLNTNDDSNGGTTPLDVISQLIGAAPGLIYLSRTPSKQIGNVPITATRSANGTPVTQIGRTVTPVQPINLNIVIVALLAIVLLFVLFKR